MKAAILALLLVLGCVVRADAPPKLTDVQHLVLQNRILARDLAQAQLDAVVREYSVAGYDLTAAGEYVPHTDPPTGAK